jgi:hypothetical protein
MEIRVYDNKSKYLDRYTVIINTSVYGMDDKPHSPDGFNQYDGELADFGPESEWTNRGELVNIKDLPQEVQDAIEVRSFRKWLDVSGPNACKRIKLT